MDTATRDGNANEVQRIISVGTVDINGVLGNTGRTILCWAAEKGQTELVRLLLERNADPSKPGEVGYSTLHYAANNGHNDVVELLLDGGAHLDIKPEFGRTGQSTPC